MPAGRTSYLPEDSWGRVSSMAFDNLLDDGLSTLRFQSALGTGLKQLRGIGAEDQPEDYQTPPLRSSRLMPMGGDSTGLLPIPQLAPSEPEVIQAPSGSSSDIPAPAPAAPPSTLTPGSAAPSPIAGGKNPEGQAAVIRAAKANGRSDEDAQILAAVTETEGGWGGAVGDNGQSRGIYQFHERGQMPAFRAWLRKNGIEGDPNQLAYDPDIATRYAATTYLGQALDRGRALGYSGAELATYVQRTGQVSVDPDKTGANYTRLFGSQPAPSSGPVTTATVSPTQAASESRAQSGETRQGSIDPASITKAYSGVPYVFGGSGGRSDPRLGVATDCSGFVSAVWQDTYGLSLPAHTDASYNQLKQLGAPEVSQQDARPGDVVYYMGAGTGGAITHHMGIYAGSGKVLDMSVDSGGGVQERPIDHAGRFVILRDPRVNAEAPRTAQAPPPIVPSADSGGTRVSRADADALIQDAGAPPAPAAPAPPGVIPPAPGGAAPLAYKAMSDGGQPEPMPEAPRPLGPDVPPEPTHEGRFIPTPNIEPLGPALRGANVDPSYLRPGTPNRAVPGNAGLEEWTEPATVGQGTYPQSGWPRNAPVEDQGGLNEETPAQQQARKQEEYNNSLYNGLPRDPGYGYEGRPLPGTTDPNEYPWTSRGESGQPGIANQQVSYRQPLGSPPPVRGRWAADTTPTIPDTRAADEGAHELQNPIIPPNVSPNPTIPDTSPVGATLTYNDPTAGGTQTMPLPSPSPASLDPGGAQFAAQDAYSTPPAPVSDPTAEAVRRTSPTAAPAPTAPTSTMLPVWDENGSVVGYRQESPHARTSAQQSADVGPVQSTPGEPDYVPPPRGALQQASDAFDTYLPPAGGAPENLARLDQIAQQAARWTGRAGDPNERIAHRAPDDPAWRAAFPELASEYDDLQTRLGLVVGGMVGAGGGHAPEPAPRPQRQTVEVLREQLGAAQQAIEDARATGNPTLVSAAQDHAARIESDLVDATNARRALEPAITSDYGRRIEQTPPEVRGDASLERMNAAHGYSPYDNSPVPPNFDQQPLIRDTSPAGRSINLNAGLGALPEEPPPATIQEGQRRLQQATTAWTDFVGEMRDKYGGAAWPDRMTPAERTRLDRIFEDSTAAEVMISGELPTGIVPPSAPTDRLGAVNRLLGQGAVSSVSGGVGAAVNQQMNPDDPNAALKGFVAGALVPPLAVRGGRALARRAGAAPAGAEGALGTLGNAPEGGGGLGQLGQLFPDVASWYRRAKAQNVSEMASSNITPASKTEIARGMVGTVGYGSMLGPATASVNAAASLTMPVWSLVKEPTRAVVRALETRNPEALREPVAMLHGALEGLGDVSGAVWDVLRARGKYAPSPDNPNLSQRIADPIGRSIMAALETPGRAWAGGPDAIFGTIAEAAVTRRKAAQLATDAGKQGQDWQDWYRLYNAEVERVKSTGAPPHQIGAGTAQVLEAGRVAAERAGYRQPLGDIGKRVRTIARLGDAPVLGNLVAPFFNSPWNIYLQRLERTPFGLVMNTQPSKFDKYYDAAVGSALAYGMYQYASGGNINGSGPTDKNERQAWIDQGNRPYSVKIAGTWYPNRAFGYAEGLLNAAGEIHDAVEYRKPDADLRWTTEDALARVGKLINREPYAAGYAAIANAVQFGPASYAADMATRFTPLASTARLVGTMTDPSERTTDRGAGVPLEQEALQRWQLATGQRAGLPVAQNILGEPKENEQQGGAALFARLGHPKDDPVISLLQDAKTLPGDPHDTITLDAEDGIKVTLTPDERRRWDAARGAVIRQAGTQLAADPRWASAPLETRQGILQDIFDAGAEAADGQVLQSLGNAEITRRVQSSVATRPTGGR